MVYTVSYRSEEDGWLASILSVPGCHVEGATKEEAKRKLMPALRLFFDDLQDVELVDDCK